MKQLHKSQKNFFLNGDTDVQIKWNVQTLSSPLEELEKMDPSLMRFLGGFKV